MKTNREYPATHSMSTSWYAVDLDGNVAIIEFNENGPVPVFVPDTVEDDIIFNQFASNRDQIIGQWPYSVEEVDKMLEDARDAVWDVKNGDLFTTVIKVDMARYDEFMEIARLIADEDDCNTFCIDWKKGLFYVDWCGETSEQDTMVVDAVESGLITPLKVINIYQDSDSPYDLMRNYPFYVYRQDYDSLIPIRRTVVPKKPFSADRIPTRARASAIRLPLRFKDAQSIQIARYTLCHSYDCDATYIDRRCYRVFKQEDGALVYIAESSIIKECCGKTCHKCCPHGEGGASSYEYQRIKEPTILVVKDLEELPYEMYTEAKNYLVHSVFVPILPEIPCRFRFIQGGGDRSVKKLPVEQWFKNCRITLEENILFFHPYAVLLYREVIPFVEKYYPIKEGKIYVGEHAYPFFVWEEREQHLDEIERLACLPYRGGHISWVIPLNEDEIKEYAKYNYL